MPIIIAKTDEEINETYELMKQLRPHLEKDTYVEKIRLQQKEHQYKLIVFIDEGIAKAAAGFRLGYSLAWGKYMYIDDLITDEQSRSKGYAKHLFDWLDEEVLKTGCEQLHLDSGVHRFDAHRFYLNRKMKISSHHFQKSY